MCIRDRYQRRVRGTNLGTMAQTLDHTAALSIAQQFMVVYYQKFDSDRSTLADLYTEASSMTFEGSDLKGQQAILQKLTSLTFQKCQHDLNTARLDVQEIGAGIMILCTGQLQVDQEPKPMLFTEVFVLMNNGASWYIHNHMFRLNVV
eukprot:TRINITY_DN44081_c0_g1_i2.p1 TRINITY_DN44081_c0_g1~~TRINITY_DN44081_c0_g1_i2.p1  ORF type:complete len:148 (+),score=45.26 TRINITY_DN44081_c0_g1_i2:118-561(+)